MTPGSQYHHPRYCTKRIILAIEGKLVRCQESDEDGYQRIVMPFRSQMERWLKGAEEITERRAA